MTEVWSKNFQNGRPKDRTCLSLVGSSSNKNTTKTFFLLQGLSDYAWQRKCKLPSDNSYIHPIFSSLVVSFNKLKHILICFLCFKPLSFLKHFWKCASCDALKQIQPEKRCQLGLQRICGSLFNIYCLFAKHQKIFSHFFECGEAQIHFTWHCQKMHLKNNC